MGNDSKGALFLQPNLWPHAFRGTRFQQESSRQYMSKTANRATNV